METAQRFNYSRPHPLVYGPMHESLAYCSESGSDVWEMDWFKSYSAKDIAADFLTRWTEQISAVSLKGMQTQRRTKEPEGRCGRRKE